MPIMEFKCVECGAVIEVIQKTSDPDPVCGCGHMMKKQLSLCSFHLKGNGWYKSDYQSKTNDVKTPTAPAVEPIRAGYNQEKK